MSRSPAPATKSHPPTSPNTAPATQNECHHWSASHMKRHFQCAEQVKSPSNLTKYCACHEIWKLKIWAETPWSASANRKTIRGYPTIIWTQNRHLAPAASETLLFPSWRRFCIVKYNISRSGYLPKCHEMLRLPRKVTLQPHQILRLPRKMNVIIDVRRTWGSHFQCVEQVKSPSNISKYCACHAKWMSTVLLYETSSLRNC